MDAPLVIGLTGDILGVDGKPRAIRHLVLAVIATTPYADNR
jgi:hypothetical protein